MTAADALPETGAVCETRWTAQCRRCDKPATVEMFAESGALLMSVWHNCQCTEGFVLRPVPAPVPSPSGDPLDGKLDALVNAARLYGYANGKEANARAHEAEAKARAAVDSSLSSLRARVGELERALRNIAALADAQAHSVAIHGDQDDFAIRIGDHARAATSTTEADRAE